MTFEDGGVMSSAEAARRAGITYRQLDHWERQDWIRASQIVEVSPRRRVRRYRPLDVARLATLRHLAACRFDLAVHGPTVGALELSPGVVVVAGGDPETVRLVDAADVTAAVGATGRWSVFDPTELLTPIESPLEQTPSTTLVGVPSRRSA